jgi:hypothetical protein
MENDYITVDEETQSEYEFSFGQNDKEDEPRHQPESALMKPIIFV